MRSKLSVALLAVSLAATVATTAFAAQGWLGVTTQSTDSDLRRSLDLTRDGLLVNRVSADSPADRAGLQRGDVILSYNSRSVTDPDDLRQLVRDTEPGRSVAVAVWRDGERRTLNVKVGELPADEESLFDVPTPRAPEAPEPPTPPTPPRAPRAPRAPESSREYSERHGDDGTVHRRMIVDGRELSEEEMKEHMKDMDKDGFRELKELKELKDLPGMSGWSDSDGRSFGFSMLGRGRLGVRVEKLTGDLAQALGVDAGEGVLVVQVMEDTPAQKAGVRAGDVIVKVGAESVSDPDELVKALRSHDGSVDIVLLRKGARRTIQAELDRAGTRRGFAFEPDVRRFNVRIPEPGKAPQVYRWRAKDQAENENLREELRQLRRELQELRREMGERK